MTVFVNGGVIQIRWQTGHPVVILSTNLAGLSPTELQNFRDIFLQGTLNINK
jgi:hypothetical protein